MLRFKVRNQVCCRVDMFDPATDSQDYLLAEFDFETQDWAGKTKTAFFRIGNSTYKKILNNNTCKVPNEVLVSSVASKSRLGVCTNKFCVSVVGEYGTERITTNEVKVELNLGYRGDALLPDNPTESEYQQIVTELQNTRNEIENVIQQLGVHVVTDVAETHQISDSSECRIDELVIYGKSVQNTMTGKNLADLSKVEKFTSGMNSADFEVDATTGALSIADGSDATTMDMYCIRKEDLAVVDGEKYTLSLTVLIDGLQDGDSTAIAFGIAGMTDLAEETIDTNGEYNFAAVGEVAGDVMFGLNWNTTNTCCKKFKNIQLELGILTEFEPYVGGVASPNPDYPQEIANVGDSGELTQSFVGKNLLPYPYRDKTKTTNGITFTDNGDGTVTANGTASNLATFNLGVCNMPSDNNVILNGCPSGGSSNSYKLQVIENGSDKQSNDFGDGTFVSSELLNGIGTVKIVVYAGTTVSNITFKPMLRLSSVTDDKWEPYRSTTATVTLPEPLRAIPVSSGGNVTIDDQQYISDVLTVYADGSGFIERRTCRFEANSAQGWELQSLNTNNNGLANFVLSGGIKSEKALVQTGLCNRFKSQNSLIAYETEQGFQLSNCDTPTFRIFAKTVNTLDGFKQWLDENPTYIIYALAVPVVEELTEIQISGMLKTYKLNSYVSNSEYAHSEVGYVADARAYIDRRLAEL